MKVELNKNELDMIYNCIGHALINYKDSANLAFNTNIGFYENIKKVITNTESLREKIQKYFNECEK